MKEEGTYEFMTAGDIRKFVDELKKNAKPMMGPEDFKVSEQPDDNKPVEPGSPEWQARVTKLLLEETDKPMGWWYLSYAGEGGFRGGAVIEARGFTGAAYVANILKISPGGQVMGAPIPSDQVPGEEYRHRLLTKDELNKVWGDMETLGELEAEDEGCRP